MNDLLEPLRAWFAGLAPRERIMVAVCAVFVVGAGLWTVAIEPLFKGGAKLEQRVADKEARLANLQELASQVRASWDGQSGASARPTNPNESIVVVIDRTTRSRQLAPYLKRNQPDGTNGVRLRLEGAPFDVVVAWLGELRDNYGMNMVTANFDQAGTGLVNCSLTIARQGS